MSKTVEELLREGGFTGFHREVVAVTGFAWTSVSMEILLVGFTIPLFAALWSLSGLSLGLLASASLIGSFIGSLAWGRFADRVGRRPVFQAVVLWYSVFTALSAASWDVWSLFGFRVLAGLGLGGMLVVDPSLLSEYLPPQSRGRFMVFLDFFWPIGNLLALGLAFYFLELSMGAWRYLFLAAAFPAFMAFLFRLRIPESPHFLAKSGNRAAAAAVLSRATKMKVDAASIVETGETTRAPLSQLFASKLIRASVVTLVAWVALNFSYYGLFLWLPGALGEVKGIQLGNIYVYLLLSVAAQFPGYASAMWLVEKWGRKKTFATFLTLAGLSGLVFATAYNYEGLVVGLFFVSFFNLGAWGAVYPYTSELFPTLLRATAFGMAEGVGKVTAILGPTIFGFLKDATGGILVPLSLIAVVMVVGGLTVASLGRETKGAPLL